MWVRNPPTPLNSVLEIQQWPVFEMASGLVGIKKILMATARLSLI